MEVGESYTFNFVKQDKLTGTGTITYTYPGDVLSLPFTYIIGDQKMTVSSFGSEVYIVMKYEKTRVELLDSAGDLWVLTPKK